MARTVRIAAVQAPPLPIGTPLDVFAEQLRRVLSDDPGIQFVVYPELHLFGPERADPDDRNDLLRSSAVPLDGPLMARLGEIARDAGVWLLPGSVCELGPAGELFNTAVVFSPRGELVASYRKIFPWRPYEPYVPGDRFVVFDMDGVGRFGLSICYDSWFPEVTRHLAWMGAEVILNVVKTTTPDRAQELVLAQANSIVNQTFTVSVNCAGPIGVGRSLIVDAEGAIRNASDDDAPAVLVETIDLDDVTRVREHGTAGFNRMWAQFLPSDRPLELPLYDGRIDPERWTAPFPGVDTRDDSRPRSSSASPTSASAAAK
jgi:predicted amidohydrolase